MLTAVLVSGVILTTKLSEESTPATLEATPTPAPEFRILRVRNEVQLRGHTASLEHENTLLDVARRLYPDHIVDTDFEALGIVPEHWQDSTAQTLYAVSAADSASAILTRGKLTLRSVTSNSVAWQARLSALETALAPEVDVDSQTIAVRTADTGALCGRAFAAFSPGPIKFAESTAELRPSAFPVLQRVGALASACRDSSVSIVGHTDATGNDLANQALSIERAKTVSNYLESLGVASARLVAQGAGSSAPLATNSTRYGRSLNRRIEIEFIPN